jgi:hypothetical protein
MHNATHLKPKTKTVPTQSVFDRCYFRTALPANPDASLIAVDICPGSIFDYNGKFQEIHAEVESDIYQVTVKVRSAPHSMVQIKGKVWFDFFLFFFNFLSFTTLAKDFISHFSFVTQSLIVIDACLCFQELSLADSDELVATDPIPILHGPNKIPIVITAEDFSTINTYTLTVHRKFPPLPNGTQGGSTRLKYLECWAGLIPPFTPSVPLYTTHEVREQSIVGVILLSFNFICYYYKYYYYYYYVQLRPIFELIDWLID